MTSPYASPVGSGWIDVLNRIQQGKLSWGDFVNALGSQKSSFEQTGPQNVYGAYSTIGGIGKSDRYKNWLNSQYNNYYGQFTPVLAAYPTASFIDALNVFNPQHDYAFSSPNIRGENWSSFVPSSRMMR